MSEGNFDKKNTTSIEQQDKFVEIFEMMKSLTDSIDSNEAYEISEQISKFKNDTEKILKKKDSSNLKDYFLWSLVVPNDTLEMSDYKYFDTEDGEIEEFIRKLVEFHKEKGNPSSN